MIPQRSSDTSTEGIEFSAGGVVVRSGEVVVIVPIRRDARGNRVLGLPKGHPDLGETPAQAAAREVREETGVVAELVDKLGDIEYSYERRGRRIAKTVSFFMFQYRSGRLEDHDHEIEQAFWMPLEEAARTLSFEGERRMVRRALSQLSAER
jgi:8-oxo-dGTP pyrophosphatase MutT (NUDIX family)